MENITHFLNVPILDYSHRFLLKLPYRLNVGDQLYANNAEDFGKLTLEDEVDEAFEDMLFKHCYFLVEEINIRLSSEAIEVRLKPL